MVVSLFGLVVLFGVTQDAFLTVGNVSNIFFQNAPVAIAACATTIAIVSRGFDLSIGSVFALSGVVAAWVGSTYDPVIGLVAGVLTGLVAGTLNGGIVTIFQVNSFLATLASSLIFRSVAVLISGGFLIQVDAEAFGVLGNNQIFGVEITILVFAIFAIFSGWILARTVFGRYVYAVGGNEEAARLSGVPVAWVRVYAFAASGLGAGIAGVLAASRIGQGQADVAVGLELQAIAAVVIGGTSILGGKGAMWRTVVGVFFLALITNGFNLAGFDPVYADILTGAIIIAAVTLNSFTRGR